MSCIVNIQRDGCWTNPDTTDNLTWSSAFTMGSTTPVFNNSGSVNVDVGTAHSVATATYSAGQAEAIGVLMNQIPDDNLPFRVKASVQLGGAVIIGYADASPSGTDDTINEAYYIPFVYVLDEVIMVPYDSNYDERAICIAVAPQAGSGSSQVQIAQLSVQSLSVKPPTMLNAVS